MEHADYRDLPKQGRVFDKVVSVGCLEHIGKANHDLFFSIVKQSLKPTGTFVLHTIGTAEDRWSRWRSGTSTCFPACTRRRSSRSASACKKLDMRIQDVENLRLHYSYTTQRWLAAFEAHVDEIRAMYDERLVRIFRLYLSNGVAMMRYADNELYQVVITPGIDNERPLTRDFLYAERSNRPVGEPSPQTTRA